MSKSASLLQRSDTTNTSTLTQKFFETPGSTGQGRKSNDFSSFLCISKYAAYSAFPALWVRNTDLCPPFSILLTNYLNGKCFKVNERTTFYVAAQKNLGILQLPPTYQLLLIYLLFLIFTHINTVNLGEFYLCFFSTQTDRCCPLVDVPRIRDMVG